MYYISEMKVGLLIGINYSSDASSKLNGCINDIDNMKEVLVKQYGYESSNIIMLRDDTPSRMPTRNAILAAFQSIVKASKSESCTEIWIHYSGHGTIVRDRNGDEESGRDSAIVPV
jgi:metacaspase-1